ncbi:hypothetical protein Tco_0761996 [Tanacetum coccineum]
MSTRCNEGLLVDMGEGFILGVDMAHVWVSGKLSPSCTYTTLRHRPVEDVEYIAFGDLQNNPQGLLHSLHKRPVVNSTTLQMAPWNNPTDEDDCFTNFETESPAIVFDDTLTSDAALSFEPTVSPLNENKIDFRISFDESDDEDYTVIFDKNSFSYKINYVDNLKTDSENDNDKVDMHSFPSPEPTVSYFDDLDYFKDFEKEFLAIVYNDALTSKLDSLTEPAVSPHHIDELDLKNDTSLSKYDEEEQSVVYFNDLFPLNIIYPDDLSDKDNNNDKIDIEHSSGDLSIEPLPNISELSWTGRLNYVRAVLWDNFKLKEAMVVAVPRMDYKGINLSIVQVEYEW